jgi:hypothetical protein
MFDLLKALHGFRVAPLVDTGHRHQMVALLG